ncbi:MAG TPA: efflux RND transporter periplasmic adaptor subunit [Gammaproteobacteria bacterium]|jgi:RND family efflux transporter MFP subunit|nr:efflux RND transporter periplasmic adaptor subunit [Gammaproteobacteria bacterium]
MKRIAWIISLATAAALFAALAARADDEAAPDAAVHATALVQTAVAAVREVSLTLSAYGSVTPGPQGMRNVVAAHAGEVTAVEVLPGAVVKQGAPLLTLAAAPETAAAYTQAKSEADFARTALERTRGLFQEHLATNTQLADAERASSEAAANLTAAEKLGGGQAESVLRAPADGVVGPIAVHTGDRVAANAPLLAFSGTAAPYVQLGIDPEDAAKARPGMPVVITAVFDPALTLSTRVQQVGGQVDEQSGLVLVMAPLTGKGAERFMPGSAVTGEIVLKRAESVAVPRSAVLHDDQGDYVFIVKDGVAHRADIQAGIDDGSWIAVDKGVQAGDRVVTLGNYELQDGMAVREPKA